MVLSIRSCHLKTFTYISAISGSDTTVDFINKDKQEVLSICSTTVRRSMNCDDEDKVLARSKIIQYY